MLKAHLLNLYASKKTGRPVVKNTGFDLVVDNGDTPLADMIASVDRGLLLGGFSGGDPGTNGEKGEPEGNPVPAKKNCRRP